MSQYDFHYMKELVESMTFRKSPPVPVVVVQNHKTRAFAEYRPVYRDVLIHAPEMYRECVLLQGRRNLSFSDGLQVFMSHEFGHAVDPEIAESYDKRGRLRSFIISNSKSLDEKFMYDESDSNVAQQLVEVAIRFWDIVFQMEKQAWKLGESFVAEAIRDHYREEVDRNLELYQKERVKSLNACQNLKDYVYKNRF